MAQQLDVLSNHSGFRHNVTNGTNLLSNPNASAGLRVNVTENLDIAVNADPTTIYDITTMQQMTPFTCQNTPTPSASVNTFGMEYGSTNYNTYVTNHTATKTNTHIGASDQDQYIPEVTLIDTRDNKTYLVRKLADGNCWMSQNLELDIKGKDQSYYSGETFIDTNGDGTRDTFTGTKVDSTFDLSRTYTDLNSKSNWNIIVDSNLYVMQNNHGVTVNAAYGWKNEGTDGARSFSYVGYSTYANKKWYYVIPNGSFSAQGNRQYNMSTSDTGSPYMRNGNVYNWWAATTKSGMGIGQDLVAADSICPKSWQLPKAQNHSYNLIVDTYKLIVGNYLNGVASNGDHTNSDADKSRSFPLDFHPVGDYFHQDGRISGYTVAGGWWTSTAGTSSNAYYLYTELGRLAPKNSYLRGQGYAIRCVAK